MGLAGKVVMVAMALTIWLEPVAMAARVVPVGMPVTAEPLA